MGNVAADLVDLFSQPLTYLLLSIYFLPTMLALYSKSAGWAMCFWVNLLFGWTLIGWLICLVLGSLPTKEHYAHKDKVRRARDEFYLREQEKFGAMK